MELKDTEGSTYKIYPPEVTQRRIDEIIKANQRRNIRLPLLMLGGFLIGQNAGWILKWMFS